ncbi:hypothetical protein EBZ39_16775 [bacterium]|nr:hypothetical protein [bacterium]
MKIVIFSLGIIALFVMLYKFVCQGVLYHREKDLGIVTVCLTGSILCVFTLLWLILAVFI